MVLSTTTAVAVIPTITAANEVFFVTFSLRGFSHLKGCFESLPSSAAPCLPCGWVQVCKWRKSTEKCSSEGGLVRSARWRRSEKKTER